MPSDHFIFPVCWYWSPSQSQSKLSQTRQFFPECNYFSSDLPFKEVLPESKFYFSPVFITREIFGTDTSMVYSCIDQLYKIYSIFIQLLMIFLKTADISNEVRPPSVSEPWADCLFEEYFNQVKLWSSTTLCCIEYLSFWLCPDRPCSLALRENSFSQEGLHIHLNEPLYKCKVLN